MAMESSRGEEGTSWKNLENHGKRATHTWHVGTFYSQTGRAKWIRDDAAPEKQEGTQGQRQQEKVKQMIKSAEGSDGLVH